MKKQGEADVSLKRLLPGEEEPNQTEKGSRHKSVVVMRLMRGERKSGYVEMKRFFTNLSRMTSARMKKKKKRCRNIYFLDCVAGG